MPHGFWNSDDLIFFIFFGFFCCCLSEAACWTLADVSDPVGAELVVPGPLEVESDDPAAVLVPLGAGVVVRLAGAEPGLVRTQRGLARVVDPPGADRKSNASVATLGETSPDWRIKKSRCSLSLLGQVLDPDPVVGVGHHGLDLQVVSLVPGLEQPGAEGAALPGGLQSGEGESLLGGNPTDIANVHF